MFDRRRFSVIAVAVVLLGGLLAGCQHWPEGQYPSRQEAPRDGGEGGGGGSGGY